MSQIDSPGEPAGWRTAILSIVRILLWLIVLVFLGLLLFLGYTWIEQRVVVPAQRSVDQISVLNTQSAQDASRINELAGRVAALEERIQNYQDDFSGLRAEFDDVHQQVDRQGGSLEELEALAGRIAQLESELEQAGSSLTEVEGYLYATQSPLLDSLSKSLRTDVELLKVMQLLNRARLYLNQNNYGLARDQVELARQILTDLAPQTLTFQQPVVARWIARLDLALDNLPDAPVLAADDLEIAWQMILAGLPATPSEAPGPRLEPTATPTPAGSPPAPTPIPTL